MSRLPRSSPWGAVQHCEVLTDGVFKVGTASHGGIMVRKNAADFLSTEAKKSAISERNYLCYEEDCDASIVIRELLDKKMWHIPDRISNKEQYEDIINESLQNWNPEYWEARQQRLAPQTPQTERAADNEPDMPDARRDIIFRDLNYKTKFKIKDGESIKVTIAFDGEEVIRKCRFINETHLYVGSQAYHIDEFEQRMTKAGNMYEPIPNQEAKIDVVIAEPGKLPRYAEIPMSMAALRKHLGGEPEIISKDKFSAIVKGINGNGTIAACGINGDNLTSLHPYSAQTQKRELAVQTVSSAKIPGKQAVQPKPSTLAGRLEAGKAKAAAQNAERKVPDVTRRAKSEALV